jgi:hypothetical protein
MDEMLDQLGDGLTVADVHSLTSIGSTGESPMSSGRGTGARSRSWCAPRARARV